MNIELHRRANRAGPITDAVIVAGGMATRLRNACGGGPKALVPIGGEPLIAHQLRRLARSGVTRVWLMLGHGAAEIMHVVEDGRRWGLRCHAVIERTPLGTAGNLPALRQQLGEHFYVVYGDLLFDFDVQRLGRAHLQRDALATLLVQPNDHPHDSDLVQLGDDGRIAGFLAARTARAIDARNLVNAAIYALSRDVIDRLQLDVAQDFVRDLFAPLVERGAPVYAHLGHEYLSDVGTPDRLSAARADWAADLVRSSPRGRPAVFLDLDGVLKHEVDGLIDAEALVLFDGTVEALRLLRRAGYLLVVVTNLPMHAERMLSEAELARIHARLETLLGNEGAYLDRIYVCPHHPQRGFRAERPALGRACDCRKPAPGLIHRAARELGIDLARSLLIGDSLRDIGAARAAGIRAIGVRTGAACRPARGCDDLRPDQWFDDLLAAARALTVDARAQAVVAQQERR